MIDSGLLNWTLSHILIMMIIFIRVGPVIFFMPITGTQGVPPQVKVLMSLMTALVLIPAVPVTADMLPQAPAGFLLFVGKELFLGAILALFVRFVFAAVEIAGQMVSIQMGMGMAGTIDPQFGNQISLVGFFWNLVTILLFLSVDGHHIFFRTLADSFNWIKPGALQITRATFEGIIRGGSHMFVLAVKIMAPAAAALFFSHVAMGIIAKTVPQIPILIVGLPINIAIGLIFCGLSLMYLMPLMISNFDMIGRLLGKLVVGMGV